MKNNPLVSIIMPVFNSQQYIEAAVASVRKQTYPGWELLIIDDGSADDSWSMIEKYALEDNRIRGFKQENKGVSAARNVGLNHLKGELICFLDSDDWLPPRSLEDRINKFKESESIRFVDGSVNVFSQSGKDIERVWIPAFTGNPMRKLLRLSEQCFFGPTWMIRWPDDCHVKFAERMTHCEELLFYIELAHTGDYAFVGSTVYCYRNRKNSAMKDIEGLGNGYRKLKDRLQFLDKFDWWSKMVFEFKTRKIMFLCFLTIGNPKQAIKALFN